MLTHTLRSKIRSFFGRKERKVRGTEQALGYLRELPHLTDYVAPGHSWIREVKVSLVGPDFLDASCGGYVGRGKNQGHSVSTAIYAVDRQGAAVAKLRDGCPSETVYKFLTRIRKRNVRFTYLLMVTLKRWKSPAWPVSLTYDFVIYKFEKGVSPEEHADRLVAERARKDAEKAATKRTAKEAAAEAARREAEQALRA